jgi:predicted metalloendopeptidase
VLALETAIAHGHATPETSADERNVDNVWPRGDFVRRAPGMHWDAFFEAGGLSQQDELVVWQPDALKSSAALVGSQPLAAWLDYLRFHVIDRYAAVLPRAFAERALAFHGKSSSAEEATQQALAAVLGRLYVARHFPPETKARAQAIVVNVIAAFRERIESVTWLSASSRKIALAKLQAFHFDAGYPAKAADYSDLTIDPRDALGNLRRAAQWNYRKALAHLGQPVDRTEWWIQPQTVGAVLLFQQNAYNFSAALLQPPKFDPAASDAANYGAFGAIVGHETSHVIDTLGAEYDAAGRKTRWWTQQDYANFQAASAPLVQQFSDYRPFADAAVDGKLTQVENVADLAGLSVAFDAYRRTLGSKLHDKEYVRQQDREFFIGFARSWRGKTREDALRRYLVTDGHAPERFRIATVRNIDAWYDAFDVRPGQRLYLEPRSRVRVW